MGKIICIANQKGGVGKTTTVINLSASLAHFCKSVLVIDFDPQANTTSGFGINKNEVENSIYQVLVDEMPIKDVIVPTAVDWLEIVPSTNDLIGAEVELVSMFSRETKLKHAVKDLRNMYDYVFIDCPPSLGLLTVNALTAADSVIVPIQCEYYPMEGLSDLVKTLNLIRKQLNPNLELEGIVLTMYDPRLNLSNQVSSEVKKFFSEKVYKTCIPRNVRLAEAPSFGKPIILYDRNSRGSETYLELAEEFMKKEKMADSKKE